MKKEYKNPTLKVVNVKPATIMTTSNMENRGNYDSSTVTIGARGSRYSTWEEDAAADYDE